MEANMVLPQSVLHPESLSPQECPISYLSALSAHLGAPTLHSSQSQLPISSLPSTSLSLAHCPGLVSLSGISDDSSEHQDCSRLFESELLQYYGHSNNIKIFNPSDGIYFHLFVPLSFLSPVSYCLHYRGVSPHLLNLFLGILFFFMQLWWYWAPFHIHVDHLYTIFGNIYWVICQILLRVFSILRCMISLHILKINCMLYTQFTKDFLQFHRLPFLFCWLFLLLCKMFVCGPTCWFCFCYLCICDISKNHCHDQCQGAFFFIFSPGSFMVSGNSKRTRNRKGTWTSECILQSHDTSNHRSRFLWEWKWFLERNLPMMEMLWRFWNDNEGFRILHNSEY